MSVVWPDDIKDGDCERGMVTQRPPISYAQFKYPKWITEPDSVKVRLPKGNQYTCDLMNDASNAETYVKWVQVYIRVLGKKNLRAPLGVAVAPNMRTISLCERGLPICEIYGLPPRTHTGSPRMRTGIRF